MEVFLNILWACIALFCLWVWRSRWAAQARARHHAPWTQWTAVICALILLFFMVSLTDDLHSELVVFEECSVSRRHADCLGGPHHGTQDRSVGVVGLVVASANLEPALARIGIIAPLRETLPAFFGSSRSGRAPPVVSL